MTKNIEPPLFLLYKGESDDGRGKPDYIGRTGTVAVAKKHYIECSESPYSNGKVIILTDTEEILADRRTDWKHYD